MEYLNNLLAFASFVFVLWFAVMSAILVDEKKRGRRK